MPDRPHSRLATIVAALLMTTPGFLPIADLLPGGESLESYRLSIEYWALGTSIAAGLGIVVAVLIGDRQLPGLTRGANVAARLEANWHAFALIAALGALTLYLI